MDAVDFFDAILPSDGFRCLAVPRGDGFAQFFGETNGWLAEASQHLDTNRSVDTYFACATFKERGSRKGPNVLAVRSFWADIDCGPGKPYASARHGAAAILGFCAKLSLPRPYMVSSGRGVHVYWPMLEDMTPELWRPTAQLLKAALQAEGVHQDMTRTADVSSILRPPGTHHRKAAPIMVRVSAVGVASPLDAFQEALLPYAHLVQALSPKTDDLPPGGPAFTLAGSPADDLINGAVDNRPSSAHLIATKCAVIREMRDTGGVMDQSTWYGALGVLAYTQEGSDICHEWSKGDPRYRAAEVDSKLAQLKPLTGPTTCAKFRSLRPTTCGACMFTVTSPISLGRSDGGETIETTQTVKKADGGWREVKILTDAPGGYKFAVDPAIGKRCMQHKVMDPDGNNHTWETFCEDVLMPITRLWVEGVAYVECELDMGAQGKRRFLLEGGTIGKGKDVLAAELGRNEIVTKPGKERHMDGYMKAWMTRLKDTAAQVVAHRHFGWTIDKGFVLGDTVLQPDGSENRAVLLGLAKSKGKWLVPSGDLDTWVRLIDKGYNAPGQEGYQFIVAAGFAAPLLSMMNTVNGITIYAHSEGSGIGKTTAQKAALSIWGNPNEILLADKKATANSLWGLFGAYNSLPVAIDELTNLRNEDASDLVFSVSSGRAKERMRADGELRENNSNWCTIMIASGNNLLSEKLALHRANAEAEVARLFEYTLTASPHLSPNEALDVFPKVGQQHGVAGRVYARYLVDHYEEVQAMLLSTQKRLNEQLGISQAERHWSALLATTLVAVAVCRKLGLLQFDMKALRVWLVDRLAENRVQKSEASTPSLELFGNMLTDVWQGILVTNGEGDMRSGQVATVIEKPRGALVGRAILPVDKREKPVLVLNAQAIRDWANKKGVSAKDMFAAAVAAGWAERDHVRYSLGRGTLEYASTSSYVRCWKLLPERIGAGVVDSAIAQKLGVVQGGLGNVAGAGGS